MNKNPITLNHTSIIEQIISWLFGGLFVAIGIINTFWGNDAAFGIFILLLSLVYFFPVNGMLKRMTGYSIPRMGLVKILLGIFILFAALGVGEIFAKVDLMLSSF